MPPKIGKTKDKSSVNNELIYGIEQKDNALISNIFCKYFINVSKDLADKIPQVNKHFILHIT